MDKANAAAVAGKRMIFFGLLLAGWQGLYSSGVWSPLIFPSPADTWSALSGGFGDGTIPAAVGASLRRVLIGYGMAVILGLSIGAAMARWRTVQQTLGSLVLGMQTLPSICWLPLALLWFGLDEKAVILVVILGSTFAVTEASYSGFKQVPALYRRAALTMGANQLQMLRRVLIPAALPSIITGMKLSWSFAWRSLMAGELLYSDVGLGQLLNRGRDLADMGGVVAIMVVIVAIGLLVNGAFFAPVERHVRRRWGVAV
ncbi:MAG TPA: ABC transporter permease [Chloroflexota bacterium]|nr:ABC transporter permease [Chloroflexota bacterium]